MLSKTKLVGFQDCETAIALPKDAIATFCTRWEIDKLYLFGSILRDDFHADSDIDIMVTFAHGHKWGFEIVDMKDELESLFGRKVDFMTRKSIESSHNPIRKKAILSTAKLFYASR